ncbi:sigma-54-dependent transcriptional regulator [Candidatus Neomarinimicrobiota bacterium]
MTHQAKQNRVQSILIADDDPIIQQLLGKQLEQSGYHAITAGTLTESLAAIERNDFDLVLLDVQFPDGDSLNRLIDFISPDGTRQVIMMTASGNTADAVRAVKEGAFDYVEKPIDLDRLTPAIDRALDLVRANREIIRLHINLKSTHRFEGMIGESQEMAQLYQNMSRVLDNPITILLQAESGTGKELVAAAIHNNGNRSEKPFVAINCAAIPETLIESELFGHEKGSFTGANSRMIGKFEQAEGGTVFLDEIGELPLGIQARLLRVLQERELVRLGGKEVIKLDVRVIAATNQSIYDMVKVKQFRDDLYYRLSVFPMTIPPLRERFTDIPLLAAHFLNKHQEKLGKNGAVRLTPEVLNLLINYDWPGNVRELENMMQRALILVDGNKVLAQHLPPELISSVATRPNIESDSLLPCSNCVSNPGDSPKVVDPVSGKIRRFQHIELDVIQSAIKAAGGNISSAAKQLGLSRVTVYRKINRLKSDVEATSL